MKVPVLKIRDANGNIIPINAIKGDKGKSAYEQAKEGGYTGTEQEFIAILNGLTATERAEHYADFDNPHNTTAEQIGAIPTLYPTSTDLNTELTMGGNRSAIHCYYETTLNTPYKEGKTDCTHGMVITNAHNSQYATQLCIPSGQDVVFVRRLNGMGISSWSRLADTSQIDSLTERYHYLSDDIEGIISRLMPLESGQIKIATGSYKGTNTYGIDKPNTLTFEFGPKFVFVSKRGKTNFNSGATFLWLYPDTTMNFCNNGSSYWCYPTLNDKTLSWYNTQSAAYQLNSANYDYDYLAWG